jgi:hypothetical protein
MRFSRPLISLAHIGYLIPKRPEVDPLTQSQTVSSVPSKKTFWGWVTKKLGWF